MIVSQRQEKISHRRLEKDTDQAATRNVTVITAVLIFVSLLVGAAAYNAWIGFNQYASVETKLNDAAMELEINAVESSLGLLQYYVDNDRSHFSVLEDDEQDFLRALKHYRNVSQKQSSETEEFLTRAAGAFSRLLESGDALASDEENIRHITAGIYRDLAIALKEYSVDRDNRSELSKIDRDYFLQYIDAISEQITSRDHHKIDFLLEKEATSESNGKDTRKKSFRDKLLKSAAQLAKTNDGLMAHASAFKDARDELDDLLDDELQAASTARMEQIAKRTWIWCFVGLVASLLLAVLTLLLGLKLRYTTRSLTDSKKAVVLAKDRVEQALATTDKLKASAERLALVAKHTDNGVVITDIEGRIEWTNEGFTRLTGYALEEVVGKKPGHFLQGSKTDPQVVDKMREAVKEKKGFKVEILNYSKGGSEYWVQIDAMPLENESGEIVGFFSIERDLTAEKKADIIVADARRNSHVYIDAIDLAQGRMELSPEGVILDVNQNLAEVMGYTCDELVGVHHNHLVSEETASSSEYENFWRLLREGHTQMGEYERIAKDGSTRWVSATFSPMLDKDGHVHRILKYAIDHTEHHTLQVQLSRAQKLESIGQMAAGIAHEINTPMQFIGDNIEYLSECSNKLFRVVDCYSSLLTDNNMPKSWNERRKEMEEVSVESGFERIRNNMPAAIEESREGIRRTVQIVRAMKEFSHPGAKEKMPACLNDLIQSTVAITRGRWKYAAEVEFDLAEDLPKAPIYTSEINQVLLNLIVNAGDAIQEKNNGNEEDLGKIAIRSSFNDQWVIIEIEDDGCGIPEGIQQKIFDPFFTTKEVGKGTGQGLSIVHNVIVNQHKGLVSLSSQPGVGTKFVIKLPIVEPNSDLEPTNQPTEISGLV